MSEFSDFNYCEEIIKINSKSFYKAFSYLPKNKSKHIYAVYAFCRIVDDISDVEKSKDQLNNFEIKWQNFKNGKTPDEPMWRALAVTFSKYQMNIIAFDDMIKGQKSDFNFSQPENIKKLEEYCYYVAGTVGLMILPILSTNHILLNKSAVTLGKAMQITNILRDIGEDYRNGRVYIPKNIMLRHGLDFKDFEKKIPEENFVEMWEEMAQLSEKFYNEALEDVYLYDADSIFSVLLSATLYMEILNEIRRNKYDCLNKRNFVKGHKKSILLLKAYFKNIKLQKRKKLHRFD